MTSSESLSWEVAGQVVSGVSDHRPSGQAEREQGLGNRMPSRKLL